MMTKTDLVKLDATGHELWRRADAVGFPPRLNSTVVRVFAPLHDGGVAVLHDADLEVWAADARWSRPRRCWPPRVVASRSIPPVGSRSRPRTRTAIPATSRCSTRPAWRSELAVEERAPARS
jgi:hypothetical protein